jgi:hypothetical protein
MSKLAPWIVLLLMLAGCSKQPALPDFINNSPPILSNVPPEVRSFVELQEQRMLVLAQKLGEKPDSATVKYFQHARKGEYRAASLIFQELRERGGKIVSPKYDPHLRLPLWDPLVEVQLTLDAYAAGAGPFATTFGQSIVESIPPGSIYFGGTDTGRGLVAAFCRTRGDAFFVLTQNQLTDGSHFDYLRAIFGDKIKIPAVDDSQRAIRDYLTDAGRRYEHDRTFTNEPRQLRAGEDVKMVDGRTSVVGQFPTTAIIGLLTRRFFELNPNREFYVEESFPLDWMYPHLTPHGFIMKINRNPVAEMRPEMVTQDREFWKKWQTQWIGDWLTPQTSVQELCSFAEAVFQKNDYHNFKGDTNFVGNDYASAAYSKLRSAQATLYAWRAANTQSDEERQRLLPEADFAFQQSLALCPTNPDALWKYASLLFEMKRLDDAMQIARTAVKLKPSDSYFTNLVKEIEILKRRTEENNTAGGKL